MKNNFKVNENNFVIEEKISNGKSIFWATEPVTGCSKWGYDKEEAKMLLSEKLLKIIEKRKNIEKPLNNVELNEIKKWLDENFSMLKSKLKEEIIICDDEFKQLSISVFINHFDIVKERFEKERYNIEVIALKIKGFYRFAFCYGYDKRKAEELILKYNFKENL